MQRLVEGDGSKSARMAIVLVLTCNRLHIKNIVQSEQVFRNAPLHPLCREDIIAGMYLACLSKTQK